MNKSLEEKRNKIIEYNKIIKGQENLKKLIKNNIINKKQFENIKEEFDKKIKNKIELYINKFIKKFVEEIKIKTNELIESYINKLNKYENERQFEFKEKNEKNEKLKLDFIKIINSSQKTFNKRCKQCEEYPIKGILYECSKCEGYYLCEKCEELNYLNKNHQHYFIKIRDVSSKDKIDEKKIKINHKKKKIFLNYF
jgi:hypothetical protein